VTAVNTSKQIMIENVEGSIRVRLFLFGLPADYESWQRAFELVSGAAADSNPIARYLAARLTSDADLVIEATIPYTVEPEEVLSSVDAFIQEADARYAITDADNAAMRAKVQNWWQKRVAQ
jgi:hypothetical protein